MQTVRLLLLLHVAVTSGLLLLLSAVVAAQWTARAVRHRLHQPARVAGASPSGGASVLDWTVDLRGVGQRGAPLRT